MLDYEEIKMRANKFKKELKQIVNLIERINKYEQHFDAWIWNYGIEFAFGTTGVCIQLLDSSVGFKGVKVESWRYNTFHDENGSHCNYATIPLIEVKLLKAKLRDLLANICAKKEEIIEIQ